MVTAKNTGEVAMAKRKSPAADKGAVGGVEPDDVVSRSTGINLPSDVHALLRAVALKRAKEMGGRPSVSAILVDLAYQPA